MLSSQADAILNWDGGMVLVSHDFRLIGQVCGDGIDGATKGEIWECRDGNVFRWPGDILSFKKYFRAKYAPEEGKGEHEQPPCGLEPKAAPL